MNLQRKIKRIFCQKLRNSLAYVSKVVQVIIGVVVALVGALIIKILLSNVLGL